MTIAKFDFRKEVVDCVSHKKYPMFTYIRPRLKADLYCSKFFVLYNDLYRTEGFSFHFVSNMSSDHGIRNLLHQIDCKIAMKYDRPVV